MININGQSRLFPLTSHHVGVELKSAPLTATWENVNHPLHSKNTNLESVNEHSAPLSVHDILRCDRLNESYRAVSSYGTVYYAVQGGSSF